MMLRAQILLGWREVAKDKPLEVDNLYTGLDGEKLVAIHADALKGGKYVAFRRFNNPIGNPMPVVVDPPRKPVVFPDTNKTPKDDHPVGVAARKAKVQLAKESGVEAPKEITLANNDAQFALLNQMTKASLLEEFNRLNAAAVEKITLPESPKKADVLNAVLKLQGFTPPAVENVTEN